MDACKGIESAPFRLYKPISFDKLHVFDLGVLRIILNNMHTFFLDSSTCTMHASKATKVANQGMRDLPRSAKLRKIGLFSQGSDDRMAGVTWQMRREIFPFMWVCVMGPTDVASDEDPFVRMCLLENEINIQLSGINVAYRETILNDLQVDNLQSVCHKLGEGIVETFGLNVNTKLYGLMWHVKKQLSDFGGLILSTNDLNEKMLKCKTAA